MKRAVCVTGLVMFGAFFGIVGCGNSLEDNEGAQSDSWIVSESEGSPTPQMPDDAADKDSVDKLQNCVYINYCDEPNSPRGTICRAKTGCASLSAIVAECDADVRAVCGSAVQPKYIDYY